MSLWGVMALLPSTATALDFRVMVSIRFVATTGPDDKESIRERKRRLLGKHGIESLLCDRLLLTLQLP